jgi:hypothetical protein
MIATIPRHRFPLALWGVLFLGMTWSAARADEPPPAPGPYPPAEDSNQSGPPIGPPLLLNLDPNRPGQELPSHLDHPDWQKNNFEKKYDTLLGMLSTRLELKDSGNVSDGPLPPTKFQTEQAMQMKVTGPVSLFGQVGVDSTSMDSQALKLQGKSGLAVKCPGWPLGELQLRGGPCVTYDDPLRPVRTKEQSELFLELQCKCPLPGKIQLEYLSTATPALTDADRERLKQDFHLAFPIGTLGKLNLGAKHSWESAPGAKTGSEGMEYYIGVDLKR